MNKNSVVVGTLLTLIVVLAAVFSVIRWVSPILFVGWLILLMFNATFIMTENELGDTIISLDADAVFTWWLISLGIVVVWIVLVSIIKYSVEKPKSF